MNYKTSVDQKIDSQLPQQPSDLVSEHIQKVKPYLSQDSGKNQQKTMKNEENHHDELSNIVKNQLVQLYSKVSQNFINNLYPAIQQEKSQQKSKVKVVKEKISQKFSIKNKIQDQNAQITKQNIKIKDEQAFQQPINQSRFSIKTSKNTANMEQKDPFNYFLKKFFDFYCKKYLNTIKDQQFQKLSQFYNSMNLTKFMMYCKDMGLLKLNKKITAKHLQQMFKSQQNQKHCLYYQNFAKIVSKCLQETYKTQQNIETKGYQHIGVLNRQNFAQVIGKLGVIVPLQRTVLIKPEDFKESLLIRSKSKDAFHMKQSRLLKSGNMKNSSIIKCHGHESHWDSNQLHPDLFLYEKQRKQQKLLQCLSIPKLNKLQPSKYMDDKLHQIIDQQYDPYLKRYNEKSIHQESQGVLKRMDERINNVVKKIR